jgi:uncharacterized protein involved in exopolysaccharide biosynthesis
MTNTNPTVAKARQILATLKSHMRLWLVPAVAGGAIALLFGIFKDPAWEASQALQLREEAVGDAKHHGRFEDPYAMKTAQETVLEIARSTGVLSAALREIGPPDGRSETPPWPTPGEIGAVREKIAVKPPKGAEFGTTEVIYLTVGAGTRERALALADAVFEQLETRMRELRNRKAQAMIEELEKAVEIAGTDLAAANARLEQIEAEVGPDLAELRNLNEASSHGANLQTVLIDMDNELRAVRARRNDDAQLQQQLVAAQKDPGQLVAMPNSLLASQPALSRLKDGLVDAQLRTAQLLGTMREAHPQVQAAIDAEQQVRRHLHGELEVAIRGLAAELEMADARSDNLENQKAALQTKLDRIARLRVRYDNLEDEANRRSEILEQAQGDLTNARANQAAAQTASLISRIGRPETGDSPVGPGAFVIAAGGSVCGLALGLGLVFLSAPMGKNFGRRITDRLRGRRSTDLTPEAGRRETGQAHRRAADSVRSETAEQPGRRASDLAPAWSPAATTSPPQQQAVEHADRAIDENAARRD